MKKIKDKQRIFSIFFSVVFGATLFLFFLAPHIEIASAEKGYKLLASFPTLPEDQQTDTPFPTYLRAIITLIIGSAIVLSVIMIVIGGIQYVLAAVPSAASDGKKKITDAVLGLLLALFAYVLLVTINPELLMVGLDLKPVSVVSSGNTSGGYTNGGNGNTGTGNGTCTPITNPGPCNVESLTSAFGDNATKASSICNGESRGASGLVSTCDLCQDGAGFSVGLFQINIIDSATSIGVNKDSEIFTTGQSKGHKVSCKGWCCTYSCEVKDRAAYDAAVAKLSDPNTNIGVAKTLSKNGTTWGRWGFNSVCHF